MKPVVLIISLELLLSPSLDIFCFVLLFCISRVAHTHISCCSAGGFHITYVFSPPLVTFYLIFFFKQSSKAWQFRTSTEENRKLDGGFSWVVPLLNTWNKLCIDTLMPELTMPELFSTTPPQDPPNLAPVPSDFLTLSVCEQQARRPGSPGKGFK